jgi:hypothetical protein
MNHEKEKWVEEVLASADNIQRARPTAGFYERTLGRIRTEASISTDYVLRIAAGLLLLVALNVFACVSFSKYNRGGDQPLQAFAKEYSISSSSDIF